MNFKLRNKPQAACYANPAQVAIDKKLLTSSASWTLVLIFCCLILTTIISYRATAGLIEDNDWVTHTQEVIEQILEISVNFRAAESRQRGYILTGDKKYQENYLSALNAVDQHLRALKALVPDNPYRSQQVAELEAVINKRREILNAVLTIYLTQGSEKGKEKLIHGGGLTAMNEFSNLVETITQEEKQLLKKRTADSSSSKTYALRGLIIGALFTTTLVFFSYYLLVNDLRRRRQVAEELANARDSLEIKVAERTQELERSNRELQEFAYIASHDLQEPLRKIQVFGDRLKTKANDVLDESARDYLERMQDAAKRMQKLIQDLLQFSRTSSESMFLNKENVDLNQQVKEVVSDLEGSLEVIQGKISVKHLPTIQAEPLLIKQLLQNLLSNALKFHRPNIPPQITVFWNNQQSFETEKMPPKFFEIAVTDNGIGIDLQFEEKIFKPFQRLHGKAEYEGTGIGLAICRKIIERHNGFIRILPAPSGQGTTFLIGFPSS